MHDDEPSRRAIVRFGPGGGSPYSTSPRQPKGSRGPTDREFDAGHVVAEVSQPFDSPGDLGGQIQADLAPGLQLDGLGRFDQERLVDDAPPEPAGPDRARSHLRGRPGQRMATRLSADEAPEPPPGTEAARPLRVGVASRLMRLTRPPDSGPPVVGVQRPACWDWRTPR